MRKINRDEDFKEVGIPKRLSRIKTNGRHSMEIVNGRSTMMIRGTDASTRIRIKTFSSAKKLICICSDSVGTIAFVKNNQIIQSLFESAERSNPPKIRFITEITPRNLSAYKDIKRFAELRHLRGLKGTFVVTENEYYAFAKLNKSLAPNRMIYSNVRTIVNQNLLLFETLWSNAVAADRRIADSERSVSQVETRVVTDGKEIMELAMGLVRRAASERSSKKNHPFVFISHSGRNPDLETSFCEFAARALKENPNLKIKSILDISCDNLDFVKKLLRAGVKVGHIDNNKIGLVVSNNECIAPNETRIRDHAGHRQRTETEPEAVWSNNPDVVSQVSSTFHVLWDQAIPSDARIAKIEEGIDLGETRIVKNLRESERLAREAFESCTKEILIILASLKAIEKQSEMYRELVKKSKDKGLKIRILAPFRYVKQVELLDGAEVRQINPANVGFTLYDRSSMLISQYSEDPPDGAASVTSSIYTTNRLTIEGIVSIFDALWRESELRETEEEARKGIIHALAKEERSRRQAQLLQDILSHDIRNYNQVSRLNAELLREELQGNPEALRLVDAIIRSIDDSTSLVEKGKRLGMIISEESPHLHPMDVRESIQRSLRLVREAHPTKSIVDNVVADSSLPPNPKVMADELIDGIFSNAFTNSVKYTSGNEVRISINIEHDQSGLKISIKDEGSGIPDNMMARMFDRFVTGAKGTGLGLSIIHALVVNRYGGAVKVSNRSDVSKGAVVEIWLPRF